jgi:long-chain acyl-CoA synthetase
MAFQAVLRIGAVIVPLNPAARGEEAAHLYRDSGIKVLITASDYLPAVNSTRPSAPALKHVILVDRDGVPDTLFFDNVIKGCPEELETEEMEIDDNAAMIYTAGTTGLPKGVVHTHFGMYYTLLGWVEEMGNLMPAKAHQILTIRDINLEKDEVQERFIVGLGVGGISVLALPLCHIYGLIEMFLKYYLADKMILLPWFDPTAVLKCVDKYKATGFGGVPTMWTMLFNHPDRDNYDLSTLKWCSCGGAPMPLELLKSWKEKYGLQVFEGWGMSELASFGTSTFGRHYKVGSVGPTMQKVSQLKIFDDNDNELPTGQIGEVVFKGFGVMKCYWNLPEETARTLKNGWLHTGDLGYLDDDGYLFLTGRKKDMIIRGGENVFPTEVENVLYKHGKVLECSVIGVPHELYGEEICAYVVLKQGEKATAKELMDFCKPQLPNFKQPKTIVFKDSLPKSGVGKILKKDLRDMWKKEK